MPSYSCLTKTHIYITTVIVQAIQQPSIGYAYKYLLEHCGYKHLHVSLEPGNPCLNAGNRKLEVVGFTIVICGSKVVCTE